MLLKQKFHLNLPQLITGDRFDLKGLTTFWWDNFDRNIETASGAGSSHNKPGIMFQEESVCTVMRMLAFPSLRAVLYVLKMCTRSRQQLSTFIC